MNEFLPYEVEEASPKKENEKNRMQMDFPMPKPEKNKLLGLAIHMATFGKKWQEDEKSR